MADNTLQTGSDTIATDDIAALSAKVQRMKVGYGDDGSYTDASATNPLPVTPGVNGGALVTTTGAIAAGATGTVGPLTVGTLGNASFIIRNTTAASAWAGAPVVVFEQSGDNTSWSPLPVVRSDTGQPGSTFGLSAGVANAELVFDCALEGISYIRARVTTGPTTNGLTIDIAAGGMPFPQGNSVLAVPTDGAKLTIFGNGGAQASFVPHTTANSVLQPWWALQNLAASGKFYRIIRLRVELTIATAALVPIWVCRSILLSSGGTGAGAGALQYDNADPVSGNANGVPSGSAVQINMYTAAPTAMTAGNTAVLLQRRAWVPVATAAGAPFVLEQYFGNRPGRAVGLRPGHQFSIVWGSAPATAVAANVEVEFTEEPA